MQFIQAKVLVFKLIHAAEWVAQQLAQQHTHGPAVHTYEYHFIVGPGFEQLDEGALAGRWARSLPASHSSSTYLYSASS
jgi:hypothetical protein